MWLAIPERPESDLPFDSQSGEEAAIHAAPDSRCSRFSISACTVEVPGIFLPMQVPVYRCSLAEEMVERLHSTQAGRRLGATIQAAPINGIPRLLCGPDLEAITSTTCTNDRCRRSCAPGFAQILGDLGLDHTLPPA